MAVERVGYSVVGSTPSQLRLSIEALGPTRAGRRFAAFTDWSVRYRYTCDAGRPAFVSTKVSARVTLPRWRPGREVGAEVRRIWEQYLSALERHEQGHLACAERASVLIERRLRELPRASSRQELDAMAGVAVAEATVIARGDEVAYDLETDGGAKQGARLPR